MLDSTRSPSPRSAGSAVRQAENFATCSNIANEQIVVIGAELSRSSRSDFSIENAPRAAVLVPAGADEPGGSVQIPVVYAPSTVGEDRGTLKVLTDDDPRRRETFVELVGSGGAPDIATTPAQIDFGAVSVGASATRTLTLSNVGEEDLLIDQISVGADGTGAFSSADTAARILAPGEETVVRIEFSPANPGRFESRVRITSNDPDEAQLELLLRGQGV